MRERAGSEGTSQVRNSLRLSPAVDCENERNFSFPHLEVRTRCPHFRLVVYSFLSEGKKVRHEFQGTGIQ